ncbi:hypothetical protein HPP92_012189 [Vanilla planifolia]|uniref:Uncharacterized protein n=1 Tax=Vanilla planifolia TaxID=51239 RepID=A0A835R173_VANPL|nr:hypothetical protein HPP92_012581 [Vanilla planifolia]KAG0484105.1 hypothetical protein HPP92_012189 [Vanilla planifolia]
MQDLQPEVSIVPSSRRTSDEPQQAEKGREPRPVREEGSLLSCVWDGVSHGASAWWPHEAPPAQRDGRVGSSGKPGGDEVAVVGPQPATGNGLVVLPFHFRQNPFFFFFSLWSNLITFIQA